MKCNLTQKTQSYQPNYLMTMEHEKDIVYSQAVKAGKRIYYLDVKRNKRDELFLAITESKKIVQNDGDEPSFTFEKHKIFLYPEDFSKFIGALSQAIGYIHENQPNNGAYDAEMSDENIATEISTAEPIALDSELNIEIDFE